MDIMFPPPSSVHQGLALLLGDPSCDLESRRSLRQNSIPCPARLREIWSGHRLPATVSCMSACLNCAPATAQCTFWLLLVFCISNIVFPAPFWHVLVATRVPDSHMSGSRGGRLSRFFGAQSTPSLCRAHSLLSSMSEAIALLSEVSPALVCAETTRHSPSSEDPWAGLATPQMVGFIVYCRQHVTDRVH